MSLIVALNAKPITRRAIVASGSATSVYTVPNDKVSAYLISMVVTNVTGAAVTVDVYNSDGTDIYYLKDFSVPANDTLFLEELGHSITGALKAEAGSANAIHFHVVLGETSAMTRA